MTDLNWDKSAKKAKVAEHEKVYTQTPKGRFTAYTHERLQKIKQLLEERGVEYSYNKKCRYFEIKGVKGKYIFYYTTGRWLPYSPSGKLLTWSYRSHGIEDFLRRFCK